jgi:hypothetical protein
LLGIPTGLGSQWGDPQGRAWSKVVTLRTILGVAGPLRPGPSATCRGAKVFHATENDGNTWSL